MQNRFFMALLLVFTISCNNQTVYHEYHNISDNSWDKDNKVTFSFRVSDTLNKHHLYIHLRNDENYAYSNLYLITKMTFPNGTIVKDTLEYTMTKPNGAFLGTGYTSIKENKFWYKENVIFESSNVYQLEIEHAMRNNGEISGISSLAGVTDVGFEIEKTEH